MVHHRMLKGSAAIVILALSGVGAFATISPSAQDDLPTAKALVESLAIDPVQAVLPSPQSFVREERYQRGDTLPGFFSRLGIAQAEVERLLRLKVFQQLRPGYSVSAEVSTDGAPLLIGFLTHRDTYIELFPAGDGYTVREERAPLEVHVTMKSAVIRSSLFAAADAANVPDGVAVQLAEVFGGDVDFHRDLRRGDRFSVVYEQHYLAGRPVRSGRLLAAEFTSQGKSLRAVYFTGSDGKGGYYAPDGKNLRKAFLRSPLEFSRVSSGFGMRTHPLMKTWRAHKGVDYAAPVGTRVRSVGDGVVEFAGGKGGYGNVVIVRHHGQYSTLYAHLSRIGAGVRKGARLVQGDTVGFVGQTGWATGPHLHYEFKVAGESRNPFAMAMPAALPVASHDLATFRKYGEPLATRLDLLATTDVALLE